MTAKQILDAFSETLMQDERILSPRERELLTNLLQNAKTISSATPEIQSGVSAVIARSVGETVAQRSFSLLGGSIVEQILVRSGISPRSEDALHEFTIKAGAPGSPQPPSTGPGPHVSPRPPATSPQPPTPTRVPAGSPQPPSPSTASRTYATATREAQQDTGVTVLDRPAEQQACSVVLDEFLAPQELEDLMSFTLAREADFQTSSVISPSGEAGIVDYTHRRSRVLMDVGSHQETILERIRGVLPDVMKRLGMNEFSIAHAETQITASNDGDFFAAHSDDSDAAIASRHLTFVYFFHREPRQFEAGDLQLHDSHRMGDRQVKSGSFQNISPRQNQIVFFPCSVLHEITPVKCSSGAFADSRFTLNGWLHK
jgi:Rps23 Pro-64 3,4-dihydroxylase Tpa1-like proline 4-hydroxylase